MSLAQTIRSNLATIVCGAIVAGLIVALLVLAQGRPSGGVIALVALVHDGDGSVHELPLDTDDELTVTTSLGNNTIAVRDGSVRMAAADCPNGTCLQHRPLSAPGGQIICLPHQLWIEVVPAGSSGGTMDVRRAQEQGDDVDLQAR